MNYLETDLTRALTEVGGNSPLPLALGELLRVLEKWCTNTRGLFLAMRNGSFEHAAVSLSDDLLMAVRQHAFAITSELSARGHDQINITNLGIEGIIAPFDAAALRDGVQTCWSAPIVTDADEFLGILLIMCTKLRPPSEHEVAMVNLIRKLGEIAIEHRWFVDRMSHESLHDRKTGLPNRILLEHDLGRAIDSAERAGKRVALMVIDLDNFRAANDAFGHAFGDELLIAVASRLQCCLGCEEVLGYLGGDEFAVVSPALVNAADAAKLAKSMLDALDRPIVTAGRELRVSASIGISVSPIDGRDASDLRRNADAAMYRAKSRGRGTFEFYAPPLTTTAKERIELAADLRDAVEKGDLELHYQPQVDHAGTIVGFEALLRWHHRTRGYVSPATFIPVAEESGLIIAIGNWVIREGIRQCHEWRVSGHKRVRMAVNVSAIQIAQADFVDFVTTSLDRAGLEPDALELEITESLLVGNSDVVLEKLRALREFGVCIAVDDFGTGYSSLAYLHRLPIDCLKIDRSFVATCTRGGADGTRGSAIVRAVARLAADLGLHTVAEGVETVAQQTFLIQNGCDHLQGYLFGKPVPAETAERQLRGLPAEPGASGRSHPPAAAEISTVEAARYRVA